jgi:hypothetical protein
MEKFYRVAGVDYGVLLVALLGTPWVVELPGATPAQPPCLWFGVLGSGCVPVQMPS